MLTVIIPAYNEEKWLNRTIANLYDTCAVEPEVIVVDQGGNGEIDKRARILTPGTNVGERRAMNLAAAMATQEYLLRIDAHCDFSPHGWDAMMMQVTGERDLTIAVLTALDEDWNRLPGHWYGLCRIIVNEDTEGRKGLECKWQKPNRDHSVYKAVEPNMGATGCGMMIRKAFYQEIGGADEDLAPMGAIGEEFAVKVWLNGGKCQTRTDVTIGHIFGCGAGYDTSGVRQTQQALWEKYGHCHAALAEKFPTFEGLKLIRTDQKGPDVRTVIVNRLDVGDTKDPETGQLLRRRTDKFRYIWLENEHQDEAGLTDKEIELRYSPQAINIGHEIAYANDNGELVKAEVA